ncbi:hypothetical protein D2V07_17135 [Aurantiacibacter zhengii]|uniref:Glycosyltransferase family 2 protein n=1 Tax=Aurantiacibacter zhengii TaxID=2307003 RepID=A0A418NN57_9SPHN|nr:hypothetical protein D2V07_17135 [Aurantiacibacter zhengii]
MSIAAHYVPGRVQYLAKVLDAIQGWDYPNIRVTLVTQDLSLNDEPQLLECRQKLEDRGIGLQLDKVHDLAHPWHLTWWHKDHLRAWAWKDGSAGDFFVYIEDDIVFTNENLQYFVRTLPRMKSVGCIPGFLRYESALPDKVIAPDYRGHQIVREADIVSLDGREYVNPDYPYWAGFIMDRELATEYLASPYSDLERGSDMPHTLANMCRERSAFALTYWNVPAGMASRNLVPIDKNRQPLGECLVWHSAENYSVSKYHSFGTVGIDEIFLAPTLSAYFRNPVWHVKAFARRVNDKIRRELAALRGIQNENQPQRRVFRR